MPIPFLAAGAGMLARRLGGRILGRLGGSAGKILRGGAGAGAAGAATTGVMRLPGRIATLPQIGRIARTGGKIAAGGAAFELGGRLVRGRNGEIVVRKSKRINAGNTRALKRSVRRINAAAKMYAKVLTAQKGTRSKGYTIKPKSGAKCR